MRCIIKIIICGPRNFNDYNIVKQAIIASGFKITEVVSGGADGVDMLGVRWAKEQKIKVHIMEAKWKDLDAPHAEIAINKWEQKYNKNAGFQRNSEMVEYVSPKGGVIAIITGSHGTADTVKKAKAAGLKVFEFNPEDSRPSSDYDYIF